MTADVIPLPSSSSTPRQPRRFTATERQAALAISYVPGLMGFLGADEDGDEFYAVAPDDVGDLPGFDAAAVFIGPGGFAVTGARARSLGTYANIYEALTVAKRDVERRVASYDPMANIETWRALLAQVGMEPAAEGYRPVFG